MPVARFTWPMVAIVFAAFAFTITFAVTGRGAAETPPPPPTRAPLPSSAHSAYLAGKMLVAAPELSDPRFAKTVIFMVSHDSTGALGLVINRPLGTGPMAKLFEGLNMNAEGIAGRVRIHYGGPVEPGAGFILHSTDYQDPDAAPPSTITKGEITFTSRLEVLKEIAAGKGPVKSMVIFGYAGWGPHQLEGEIDHDDWATAPADPDLIFDENQETKWERARAHAGRAL